VGAVHVIGAGFPRTGTTSLKAALEQLGLGPCYHMFDVMSQPGHVERWLWIAEQPRRTREDWDRVFEGYQSCLDWPASHYWRELAQAYPEAKVVLTVRDPVRWYASLRMLLTLGPAAAGGDEEPATPLVPELARMRRMRPVLQQIGRATFGEQWRLGEQMPPDDAAVALFERHTAQVRSELPAQRLLVYDVAEGWAPLCAFLGVDPPDDTGFPHLNSAEEMRQRLAQLRAGGELLSPFRAPQ
jgi:hypothetical protein